MLSEELTKYWANIFPDSLPIALELRTKFEKRWFRIHTLPQSKRYAGNEKEYSEIFRRHNLIISDLFGINQRYFLLTSGFSYKTKKESKEKRLRALDLQKNYWLNFPSFEARDFEPIYTYLYFDEKLWNVNSLNELFCLVANDEVRNVMLFSIEKNIVYHPYDGGADIIFETSELRDFYKERYKDWLSIHPLGL